MSYHRFRIADWNARRAIYQAPLIPLCHAGGKSRRKDSPLPPCVARSSIFLNRSPSIDPPRPSLESPGELAAAGVTCVHPGRSPRDPPRFASEIDLLPPDRPARPEKWRRLRVPRLEIVTGTFVGSSERRQSEAITRASGAREQPPGV